MEKNKRQIIILGALFIFFIMMIITRGCKPKQKPVVAPTLMPTETVAQKIGVAKQRKASAFKNWGRDPFAIGGAAEGNGDLVLTGILWEEGKPYCIINGRIARVGQVVAGCKILEIKEDSVTVKIGDEIRILRIGGKQ